MVYQFETDRVIPIDELLIVDVSGLGREVFDDEVSLRMLAEQNALLASVTLKEIMRGLTEDGSSIGTDGYIAYHHPSRSYSGLGRTVRLTTRGEVEEYHQLVARDPRYRTVLPGDPP